MLDVMLRPSLHRLPRGLRRLSPTLLVVVAVLPLLLVATAAGQDANPVAPPTPPDVRAGFPVWVAYIALMVLTAAVLAVGLLPAKRSHQD